MPFPKTQLGFEEIEQRTLQARFRIHQKFKCSIRTEALQLAWSYAMTSSMERRRFSKLLARLRIGDYSANPSRSLFGDELWLDRLRPNISSGIASGDVTHTAQRFGAAPTVHLA